MQIYLTFTNLLLLLACLCLFVGWSTLRFGQGRDTIFYRTMFSAGATIILLYLLLR